jgi:hypothetical protein
MSDPTAEALRREPTRLERLEEPVPAPKSPPVPQPSAEAQRSEQALNERVTKYKRGGS